MTLAVFSLASCSKEDGDMDPMEWKTDESVVITDGIYGVSADGESFTFTCSNYSNPWIHDAKDNGKVVFSLTEDNNASGLIITDNFCAEIQGNKLIVNIKANESSQKRDFSVTVTAGDIFYTFYFKQSVNAVWQSPCQIKYSVFAISDDMLRFYDISAEYLGPDGKQHTEVITDNRWEYLPAPVSIADAPEDFKCRIVAVLKNNLPELTGETFEIGYGVDVCAKFLNADGDVVFKVKQPQPSSFTWKTDKDGMQKFLEITREIEIAVLSSTINKSEIFAKLSR